MWQTVFIAGTFTAYVATKIINNKCHISIWIKIINLFNFKEKKIMNSDLLKNTDFEHEPRKYQSRIKLCKSQSLFMSC